MLSKTEISDKEPRPTCSIQEKLVEKYWRVRKSGRDRSEKGVARGGGGGEISKFLHLLVCSRLMFASLNS